MKPIDYAKPLYCQVVSVDPIIIVGYGAPGPFEPARTLCEALKDKRVHFLLGSWWSLQDEVELVGTVARYKEHVARYPNHSFTYMANDPVDLALLKHFGVPAFFCHQNAFVDERVFRILPGAQKKYDALYNARLDPFKHHLLTCKLNRVAHIYYNGAGERGLVYLSKIRRFLRNGVFLNEHPETGDYQYFSPETICRHYNESQTGLCLSEVEGAMYVSAEYLLSGLPVVTTKNSGGRNFFLDEEFSLEVEPDPDAVRDAVAELAGRKIPPGHIRRKTLISMLKQRKILIDQVQRIYDQEGVGRRFADEWDTVYVNKMHIYQIPNWQVLSYLYAHERHKGAIVTPLRRGRNGPPPEDFVWH